MGNKAIGLVLVAKTHKGWRRLPVAMGTTGRLKGQHGLVEGKLVYLPGSYYALRSYEGTRQVFKTLSPDASQALADLNREQRRLTARLTAADAEDMTLVDRREARIDLYERARMFRLTAYGPEVRRGCRDIQGGSFSELRQDQSGAISQFQQQAIKLKPPSGTDLLPARGYLRGGLNSTPSFSNAGKKPGTVPRTVPSEFRFWSNSPMVVPFVKISLDPSWFTAAITPGADRGWERYGFESEPPTVRAEITRLCCYR